MAKNYENEIGTELALLKQEVEYLADRIGRLEKVIYSVGAVIGMAVIGALLNLVIKQ